MMVYLKNAYISTDLSYDFLSSKSCATVCSIEHNVIILVTSTICSFTLFLTVQFLICAILIIGIQLLFN